MSAAFATQQLCAVGFLSFEYETDVLQMCDVHYSGHGVFCLCKCNMFEALAHVQKYQVVFICSFG